MYFDFSKKVVEHKLYFVGKYAARCLSYIVYRKMSVTGKENIPSDGPLIIASNHIAFSDPAVIVAHSNRTVHFMAKSELFETPIKAFFMRNMNAFPVKRNSFDRNALRHSKEILSKGWVLGVFPEGRRNKNFTPEDAKNGVAYLARFTGADVLPVCIYRNKNDKSLWHGLTLIYGEVISNKEFNFDTSNKNSKSDLYSSTQLIMNRIQELWETENENYNS